jgi:hypothetical protein
LQEVHIETSYMKSVIIAREDDDLPHCIVNCCRERQETSAVTSMRIPRLGSLWRWSSRILLSGATASWMWFGLAVAFVLDRWRFQPSDGSGGWSHLSAADP